jgi:predicted RNase H-like HicB family nuclease
MSPHVDVREVFLRDEEIARLKAALAAAEARLAEYGACAATPLMADVLAQRDALAEALRDLQAAAERMMDKAPVVGRSEAEAMDRARAALAGVNHG